MKRNILRMIAFVIIFLVLLTAANRLLIFKHEDGIPQMRAYYKEPADSIDVLCMGSSHVFANINPTQLYEQYGIMAYDLAGSMQPMWNTYYVFQEALKYQKPKVLVLDVFRLTEGFTYSKDSKVVKNTYGMRFSSNKVESIHESLEAPADSGEILMHLIGLPSYKERIWELSSDDISKLFIKEDPDNGYRPLYEVEVYDKPDVSGVIESKPIEPKTKEYFLKILELAKQNGIKVLLINAPYIINEDDKMIYNTLEGMLLAGELPGDVEYLDFNDLYEELGLDFSADFADYDHLNVNGGQKFNQYLGEKIQKTLAFL